MLRITFILINLLVPVLFLAIPVLMPLIGLPLAGALGLSFVVALMIYAGVSAVPWTKSQFSVLSDNGLELTYRWVWETHANLFKMQPFAQAPKLVLLNLETPVLLVTRGPFDRGNILISKGLVVKSDEQQLRSIFLDSLLVCQSPGLFVRSISCRLLGLAIKSLEVFLGKSRIERDLAILLKGAKVGKGQFGSDWKSVIRTFFLFCLLGWGRTLLRTAAIKDMRHHAFSFNPMSYTSNDLAVPTATLPMLRVALVDSSNDLVSWF